MKLYQNSHDLNHWYVLVSAAHWVRFPARDNGWQEQRPVDRLVAEHLHEVPRWMGFNTGMPGTARLNPGQPVDEGQEPETQLQAA